MEAAGGEDQPAGAEAPTIGALDLPAAVGAADLLRAAGVVQLDAAALGAAHQRLDQAQTAAGHLDGEAAPELVLAVDLERLAAVDRHEAHALAGHPAQGVEARADHGVEHFGIGAVLALRGQLAVEVVLGVAAEVAALYLAVEQVGHQLAQVVHPTVGDAEGAAGMRRVAAALLLGSALQQRHPRALLAGRQRGAQPRIAPADHYDVEILHGPLPRIR
ncbi:hypothetical protein D9M71_504750 [compost metagenome]